MSDFPPIGMAEKEDSAYFSQELEDNTIRSETEGGYEFTRPRSTRAPRSSFTTGFTHITQADKAILEAFYKDKRAGASIFTWTNPTNGEELDVRFSGPLQFKYVGMGGTHLWDVVSISLKEV